MDGQYSAVRSFAAVSAREKEADVVSESLVARSREQVRVAVVSRDELRAREAMVAQRESEAEALHADLAAKIADYDARLAKLKALIS